MILVVIISTVAFITNPSKDHFTSWLAKKIEEQVLENPSDLEIKISEYLTQYVGKNLLDAATTHYDYKLFGIYKVKMLNEELVFIGLFNMFLNLKKS